MKRLTLGLFLTVGMVGMSFACSLSEDAAGEALMDGNKGLVQQNDCTDTLMAYIFDCSGNLVGDFEVISIDTPCGNRPKGWDTTHSIDLQPVDCGGSGTIYI